MYIRLWTRMKRSDALFLAIDACPPGYTIWSFTDISHGYLVAYTRHP